MPFAGRVWRKRIKALKQQLRVIIEPDIVFLNQMIKLGVLTDELGDKILSYSSVPERNDALLKWLLKDFSGDYEQVMKAFSKTGQNHVVNYILAYGGNLGYFIFTFD